MKRHPNFLPAPKTASRLRDRKARQEAAGLLLGLRNADRLQPQDGIRWTTPKQLRLLAGGIPHRPATQAAQYILDRYLPEHAS